MATAYGCFCQVAFSGNSRNLVILMSGVTKCSEPLIPASSNPEDYEINLGLVSVSSNMRHYPLVTGWTSLLPLSVNPNYLMEIITGDVIYDDGVVGTVSGTLEFTLNVRKKSNINDWAAGTVKLLPSVTVTAAATQTLPPPTQFPTTWATIHTGTAGAMGVKFQIIFNGDGTWKWGRADGTVGGTDSSGRWLPDGQSNGSNYEMLVTQDPNNLTYVGTNTTEGQWWALGAPATLFMGSIKIPGGEVEGSAEGKVNVKIRNRTTLEIVSQGEVGLEVWTI